MKQLLISTMEVGSFYALIAIGYYLILQGAAFFNFAAGGYVMVSGLGAAWAKQVHGWPAVAAVIFGVGLAVVLSVLTEIIVVRSVERRTEGELPALIAVVAILFVLEQAAGTVFGRRSLPGARLLTFGPIRIGGFIIPPAGAVLIVVSIVVLIVLWVWLSRASHGRMLRAVGDNLVAARRLGFPVARVRLAAFAAAGVAFGAAGVLIAPKAGIGFGSALGFSLFGFLALVLGGTGAYWAPILGGYLLAAVQIYSSFYLGAAYIDYSTLVLAVILFAFRPEGLVSRQVRL